MGNQDVFHALSCLCDTDRTWTDNWWFVWPLFLVPVERPLCCATGFAGTVYQLRAAWSRSTITNQEAPFLVGQLVFLFTLTYKCLKSHASIRKRFSWSACLLRNTQRRVIISAQPSSHQVDMPARAHCIKYIVVNCVLTRQPCLIIWKTLTSLSMYSPQDSHSLVQSSCLPPKLCSQGSVLTRKISWLWSGFGFCTG